MLETKERQEGTKVITRINDSAIVLQPHGNQTTDNLQSVYNFPISHFDQLPTVDSLACLIQGLCDSPCWKRTLTTPPTRKKSAGDTSPLPPQYAAAASRSEKVLVPYICKCVRSAQKKHTCVRRSTLARIKVLVCLKTHAFIATPVTFCGRIFQRFFLPSPPVVHSDAYSTRF
jgi:hypothetical protein